MLYRNDAGTLNVSGQAADAGAGRGVSWGDYDGDGDLDLYVSNSGTANVLYRNNAASFNWLKVDLASLVSAPDGNGARVTAVAGGQRQVRYPDGGSGWGSQNVTPVHYGFGATSTIDSLIVEWPSGVVSELTSVTANTVQLVEESLTPFSLTDTNADGVPDLTPVPASGAASGATSITASFEQTVASAPAGSFVAYSSGRGVVTSGSAATAALTGVGTASLTLNPTTDFLAGETVFATVTQGVNDAVGAPFVGYTWQFTTAPSSGVAPTSSTKSTCPKKRSRLKALPLATWTTTAIWISSPCDSIRVRFLWPMGSVGFRLVLPWTMGTRWVACIWRTSTPTVRWIWPCPSRGAARTYQFGDGTGQFAAVDSVGGNRSTSMLAFGDLDNDGDLDIYEQNTNFTLNYVYLWNGSGYDQVFANGTNSGDGRSQFVALGDVSADGILDVVIAMQSDASVYRQGAGDGTFSLTATSTWSASLGVRVTIADLDGDGDLDAYAGNRLTGSGGVNPNTNQILLNSGSGLTASSHSGLGSTATRDIALADLDGDGAIDLIEGTWGQDQIALGNGAGSFAAPTTFGTGTDSTTNLVVADFNGDGKLDVFADYRSQVNSIYFNSDVDISTPALRVAGAQQAYPGDTVALLSFGAVGPNAGTLGSVAVQVQDLSSPTGFDPSTDLVSGEVSLFKSADAVFDAGDVEIGSAVVSGGAATIIPTVTETLSSTEQFYFVAAEIAAGVTGGEQFRVGMSAGAISINGASYGASLALSDADRVEVPRLCRMAYSPADWIWTASTTTSKWPTPPVSIPTQRPTRSPSNTGCIRGVYPWCKIKTSWSRETAAMWVVSIMKSWPMRVGSLPPSTLVTLRVGPPS